MPSQISRFMNPFIDIRYFNSLLRIFKKERFDIVHTFTVKPNFYGAIAAKLAHTKKSYSLVEGLGFLLSYGNGFKGILYRNLLCILYKITFNINNRVWFINRDDIKDLKKWCVLSERKAVFIKSIGVDMHYFSYENVDMAAVQILRKQLSQGESDIFITLIGRMNWTKGIREFIEAYKILNETHPHVVFLLVGEIQEGSPHSIPESYLRASETRNFLWLGFRDDILEIIALSDIIVLPTYYREGVPRALLEGMALSKPLVASNFVGCREVVEEGRNGYMVPIKDPPSLASAIKRLIEAPNLRRRVW